MRYAVLILLVFLAGCTLKLPEIRHDAVLPDTIKWANSKLEINSDTYWYMEARRRFNNPVIFSCHGGTRWVTVQDRDGYRYQEAVWYCFPDPPRQPEPVTAVAWSLHNLYPDRDIVMIVCNKDGYQLRVPRVWYATKLVWTTPQENSDMFAWWRRAKGKNKVGLIDGFITYNGEPDKPPTTRPILI